MTSKPEAIEEPGEDPAEPGTDRPVDPCGCIAPPAATASEPGDTHETGPEPRDTHQEPAAGVQTRPRELKLVVLLWPTGAGFQARLAAGSEGCDPELRVADVPDLPAALAVLSELAAAAETRWCVQRRYPPAPPTRQRPAATTLPRPDPSDRSSDPTGSSSEPAAPSSADPGQLSLFG